VDQIEKVMDGTSGALYSIWMNALAGGFTNAGSAASSAWSKALSHALSSLCDYTNARPPSRTLMDPLFAFTESFASDQNLAQAVAAANRSTEETKNIQAKAGRAAYVGQDQLKDAKVPDPGAFGVSKILEGIQSVIGKQ
jgi:dihydroxyacetone kinase